MKHRFRKSDTGLRIMRKLTLTT